MSGYTSNTAYQLQLDRFLKSPSHNNQCSDCKNSDPTWCSTTFNVFLCSRCASLHKQLLNKDPYYSNIKSIKLDTWTDDELFNFIHKPNNSINRDIYTTSDNPYELEQLIKRKYMDPGLEAGLAKRRANRKYPLLTNRRPRDYELSKYSRHIREIESYDRRFTNEDNIVEALSMARGNIDNAIEILRYNEEYLNSRDFRDNYDSRNSSRSSLSDNRYGNRSNNNRAPSLPRRPDNNGPKDAVFDGSFSNATKATSKPPKAAVFDGLSADTLSNLQASEYRVQQNELMKQQMLQQQMVQKQQQQMLQQQQIIQQQQMLQQQMLQQQQYQPGFQAPQQQATQPMVAQQPFQQSSTMQPTQQLMSQPGFSQLPLDQQRLMLQQQQQQQNPFPNQNRSSYGGFY